jgi:diacylglycerol kinase family enzyme
MVGLLPYGTANDMARILGWGIKPKKIWTSQLKVLARDILNATVERFNIWEVTVFLRENVESDI